MKFQYFFLVAISSLVLPGCARDKEIMVETNDPPQKRVHTQEELKKTGQSQTGAALEKVDPAVQTTHHP